MKLRYLGLALILVLTVISYSAKAQTRSSESWRSAKPKTVTLFSRAKHQPNSNEYGKSAFSFNHGVRSDNGRRITRNNYELLYGSIRLNGDSDWFKVTMGTDDRCAAFGMARAHRVERPLAFVAARGVRGLHCRSLYHVPG